MWHDITIIALLGMGWVFLFLALFALCVRFISPRARGGSEDAA